MGLPKKNNHNFKTKNDVGSTTALNFLYNLKYSAVFFYFCPFIFVHNICDICKIYIHITERGREKGSELLRVREREEERKGGKTELL